MKIVFIGAGSTVFARNLINDIALTEGVELSEIALYDINADRLRTTQKMAEHIVEHFKKKTAVKSYEDRRAALEKADFVVFMFQVGGYKPCTVTDFEIPKKYGLTQTIGDTLGVGGIMRALRTFPVVTDICREMEEVCPDAILLNYVNPMAMLCLSIHHEFPELNAIGLCHSVQLTAKDLAQDLGLDVNNIDYYCTGINHMAFYLSFHEVFKDGRTRDLYPDLEKVLQNKTFPKANSVRYDILEKFGFFVTESSEHFAEYVPWYIKGSQPNLMEKFHIPADEYLRRCETQISDWEKMKTEFENGAFEVSNERSDEYASAIIQAVITGKPARANINVYNGGLITNLPEDCCVEVPCMIDRNGINPVMVGQLPTQLAGLMQTNITVQKLTVEAYLTGNRDLVYHAAYLDPHTSAELNLDQIRNLVDDLIAAHGAWIPD